MRRKPMRLALRPVIAGNHEEEAFSREALSIPSLSWYIRVPRVDRGTRFLFQGGRRSAEGGGKPRLSSALRLPRSVLQRTNARPPPLEAAATGADGVGYRSCAPS